MVNVQLPDGTTVRATPLADRNPLDPERDLGLYLDAAWAPDWPALVIDWPDYGLPASSTTAYQTIIEAFDLARAGERLEVGCRAALGRTGTVLACFAVLCGLEAAEAIDWVRSGYDARAIETTDQEAWVRWFADTWNEKGRG